jgi:hypothetical protein
MKGLKPAIGIVVEPPHLSLESAQSRFGSASNYPRSEGRRISKTWPRGVANRPPPEFAECGDRILVAEPACQPTTDKNSLAGTPDVLQYFIALASTPRFPPYCSVVQGFQLEVMFGGGNPAFVPQCESAPERGIAPVPGNGAVTGA